MQSSESQVNLCMYGVVILPKVVDLYFDWIWSTSELKLMILTSLLASHCVPLIESNNEMSNNMISVRLREVISFTCIFASDADFISLSLSLSLSLSWFETPWATQHRIVFRGWRILQLTEYCEQGCESCSPLLQLSSQGYWPQTLGCILHCSWGGYPTGQIMRQTHNIIIVYRQLSISYSIFLPVCFSLPFQSQARCSRIHSFSRTTCDFEIC